MEHLDTLRPWSSSVSCFMIGIPNASVFPVPVFARAMMSRPSKAGFNTDLYIKLAMSDTERARQ